MILTQKCSQVNPGMKENSFQMLVNGVCSSWLKEHAELKEGYSRWLAQPQKGSNDHIAIPIRLQSKPSWYNLFLVCLYDKMLGFVK